MYVYSVSLCRVAQVVLLHMDWPMLYMQGISLCRLAILGQAYVIYAVHHYAVRTSEATLPHKCMCRLVAYRTPEAELAAHVPVFIVGVVDCHTTF